jgi:SNF2 family DNA or RNA helicase
MVDRIAGFLQNKLSFGFPPSITHTLLSSSYGLRHPGLSWNADDKFIVFSQWTDMLDMLGDMLDDEGVGYCRLDGKMNQMAREAAIADMRGKAENRVFLVSYCP